MGYIEKSEDVKDFLEEIKSELNYAIKMLRKADESDALEVCDEVQSSLWDLQYRI